MTTIDITVLKPSELITLALDDLAKCRADPKFEINMQEWYTPEWGDKGPCHVCLAGAVIAQTLVPDHLEYDDDALHQLSPSSWSESEPEIEQRLNALDEFRTGCIMAALTKCGVFVDKARSLRSAIKAELDWNQHKETFEGEAVIEDDEDFYDELVDALLWLAVELRKRGY